MRNLKHTGVFLNAWKKRHQLNFQEIELQAYVVHFQSVTLLCFVSKFPENLLYDSMVSVFKELIADSQYVFCEERSSIIRMVTHMINVCKFIAENNLEKSWFFNQIDHGILLRLINCSWVGHGC